MKYSELARFDYLLPPEQIASKPHNPRDEARLLVYDRKNNQSREGIFTDLPALLPPGALVIFNDTKVIPVRVLGKRASGGKVEVFFLNEVAPLQYKVMLSRFLPSGEKIILPGGQSITVAAQMGKYFTVQTAWNFRELVTYLEKYGQTPIPPYIAKPKAEAELRKDYQTIFAKEYGSSAAPTASLHFTKALLNDLRAKGIDYDFITLHVGLGTFASLSAENFEKNELHTESISVARRVWERIKMAKKQNRKVIAVGTTVLRTLESMALGKQTETNLFITPGFKFQIVDGLITNFHLPKSSLLLLVAAFIGDEKETLALYNYAVRANYRFFSFGDGMLVL